MAEIFIVFALFQMEITPVFGVPKLGRERNNPLPNLRTAKVWDSYDTINGVYPCANRSLNTNNKKLNDRIGCELVGYIEAITGASAPAPRHSNSQYIHLVILSIYDTRRTNHPHSPIFRYQ